MASFNIGRFIRHPLKGLENAGRSLGKIERQAAPFVGLIPGVGPGIGALVGAHGSLLEGRNRRGHLGAAATGALSGLGNAKLLGGKGALGIKGALSSGLKKVGVGGAAGSLPSRGPGVIDPATGEVFYPGASGESNGGFLDGLKKIGGGLLRSGGGGGWRDWIDPLLAGGSVIAGANASRNAGKLRNEALGLVKGQWAEGAPLRSAGRAGMLNTTRPDLSSTFLDPQNPFMRKVGR